MREKISFIIIYALISKFFFNKNQYYKRSCVFGFTGQMIIIQKSTKSQLKHTNEIVKKQQVNLNEVSMKIILQEMVNMDLRKNRHDP